MSEAKESVHALNKDLDVLPGFERKKLKPTTNNILDQQVSIDEAFNIGKEKEIDPYSDTITINSESGMLAKWSKYKNFCLASFQTRASDFTTSEIPILFSKRVRDRLAELAVTSEEAQQITSMQQNEERLRELIKQQAKELEVLHKESKHWEMIELVSGACKLLNNTQSPQFYPAQFMLVLELVEAFGKMVYDRISSHPTSTGDFLKEKNGCTQLLSLNWSMILCRTSQLLPRLLLQTAFLRCIKWHPFKTVDQSIEQIINGIHGLGSASSGIYARTYLIYTVFTYFPRTSPEILLPLFTTYAAHVNHLKAGGFKRQYASLSEYSFPKYIETHRPALGFFISVMSSIADTSLLKQALEEFYGLGEPSSFILSVLLDELQPKFVSKIFNVLLMLVDKADDVVPRPELVYRLISTVTNAPAVDGVLEVMNQVWARMKEFGSVDDFVYVAAPLARFIAKFCSPHYLNLFLTNVVSLLKQNFAAREATAGNIAGRQLTKRLTASVQEAIFAAVSAGRNFHEVLTHVGAIVPLMDFLDEAALIEVSRFILADVAAKPFQLNDPLSVRILLELSQILYQSLSVFSPVDVVEKTNNTIEWFLYRVDFGHNVEAHLNFLLSARSSFPTASRLLSVIARIALRLCAAVFTRKVGNLDVVTRSLLAFAFVTIPSVADPTERARLYVLAANVALTCCVSSFAHSCFDEFLKTLAIAEPSKALFGLCQHALGLLLVLPARPGVDPFEIVRSLIKAVMGIKWSDEEAPLFCLDAIIVTAHMLRSEFVVRIANVDSNDVLFAGNEEYQARGLSVINQLLRMFVDLLSNYAKKGVVAAKTRVPAIALRAIGALPDVLAPDTALVRRLAQLAEMTQDASSVDDLRDATGAHIEKVFAGNDLGSRYVEKYFSA